MLDHLPIKGENHGNFRRLWRYLAATALEKHDGTKCLTPRHLNKRVPNQLEKHGKTKYLILRHAVNVAASEFEKHGKSRCLTPFRLKDKKTVDA